MTVAVPVPESVALTVNSKLPTVRRADRRAVGDGTGARGDRDVVSTREGGGDRPSLLVRRAFLGVTIAMVGGVVSGLCAMAEPAGNTASTNPTVNTPFHGLNMNTLCKSKELPGPNQNSPSQGQLKSTPGLDNGRKC